MNLPEVVRTSIAQAAFQATAQVERETHCLTNSTLPAQIPQRQVAIAIFDPAIEAHPQLIAGLHPNITPYVLSFEADPIQQLTQIFQRYGQPLTVYLVAHGSPGTLYLGGGELSLSTLDRYAPALRQSLPSHSELLLYGCNVAAGDAGAEFVAKLHRLTGASVAASTQLVGNARRGGCWTLDVAVGEMAIALPFTAAAAARYPGVLITPINSLDTTPNNLLDNTTSYTAPEVTDLDGDGIETYTYNFPVGPENNLEITGFVANGDPFEIVQLVDTVELQRVDNANVTGNREIVWYEINAIDTTNNVLDLQPEAVTTLQEALLSTTVNRGADNLFGNAGSENVNNIERVDFIVTGGISSPGASIDDIGFLLLERGGQDPVTVAPILATDVNNVPTAYGTPVAISDTVWGGSGINIDAAILNDQGNSGQAGISARPGPQELSGVFLSFQDLGIAGDQLFFGYSIFPEDVGTDLVNLSDAVTTTSDETGVGGLDLVAGGVIFSRSGGSNIPPTLNLDPSNTSGGADDGNFATTFTAGGGAVSLAAVNGTGFDPDNGNADIDTLTITTNVPDGADERLIIGSTPLALTDGTSTTVTFGATTFDVAVGVTGGTATITVSDPGGDIPSSDVQALLRSLTYNNTSATPTAVDRVFSFTANDGITDGNTVTATVAFTPTGPGNTPPILNLDPTNTTGGADDRNFETTFTAGAGAVNLAADDATAIDPDNGGVDIETLTITTTVVDAGNEVLSFGDTPLTLTDGATASPTFGGITFQVATAVTGNTATLTITRTIGGDIPNTSIRPLLRSLTYNNTSAAPTTTPRVFTLIANDGLANSNTVTATVAVVVEDDGGEPPTPTPTPVPPDRDCSDGLRLAGTPGNNDLRGSSRRDIIRGFAGNDVMRGLACPDRLKGAAGNDRLFGGNAADTLDGGAGRDRLAGQNGDDILLGGGGTDRLNGGKNDDQLSGQAARDFLRGKAGADVLRGGQGRDGLAGGAGNDQLFGGGKNDQMFGGSGRDRLRGNARNDRALGGGGNDRVWGQNGRDLLRGEAGSDVLDGGAGNDRLFGGSGNDRLFGGARNDQLNGGTGSDRLAGQRGNDRLQGGLQNDRLTGGSGRDILLGGAGNDRLRGQAGNDALRGNRGRDRLNGGAGDDQLFGGRGNDQADGGARGDLLRGNIGADVLFGKAGNDWLRGNRGFDRLNGGSGNDTLDGGGAADRLFGKASRDLLRGLAGNDQLLGNNGRDTLLGGTGNDVLVGNTEGDTLQGGRGRDRFVFSGATVAAALRDSLVTQPDRIVDFDQTEGDRFALNATRGTDTAPVALFNRGRIGGPNLQAATTRAFRDRNRRRPGNQRTGANQALFFGWRGNTYLLVNNANRSFDPSQDLLVNVTGIQFRAGDANRIALTVDTYFA